MELDSVASLGFPSLFLLPRCFITASLQTYYTIYLCPFKLTTQSTGIPSNLLHKLLALFQIYYTNYLHLFTEKMILFILVQSYMYPFNFPPSRPHFTSYLLEILPLLTDSFVRFIKIMTPTSNPLNHPPLISILDHYHQGFSIRP